MEHVLTGCKVLDLTHVLSGPSATRMMAEAGAEVIKVEWPGGDPDRTFPYLGKDGRSAYYVQQNRGKRSVSVDLRTPEGVAIVKELAAQCDVLIENYSPGAMARLGLGYEVIKEVNPSIVMCSISAFGQAGPLSQLRSRWPGSVMSAPGCTRPARSHPRPAPGSGRADPVGGAGLPASAPDRAGDGPDGL